MLEQKLFGFIVKMIAASLMLVLVACAKPVRTSQQSFVPEEELDLVAQTQIGISLLGRRRYYESVSALSRTNYSFPGVHAVIINLAIALRELGAYSEARSLLTTVLKKDSALVEALVSLAKTEVLSGNYLRGESLFYEAVRHELRKSKYALASTIALAASEEYDSQGLHAQALCFAMHANAIQNSAASNAKIGRLLLADGRYSALIEKIEPVIRGARNPDLQLLYALALQGTGKFEKALKIAERLVLTAKKKPEILGEAQLLRLTSLMVTLAKKEKVAATADVLTEDDQELFRNAFMGKANESDLARFWPPVLRELLKFQSSEVTEGFKK